MLENVKLLISLPLLFTGKNFGIWFHLAARETKYKLSLLALCLLKGVLCYYYV